jgi:hypothetical protein
MVTFLDVKQVLDSAITGWRQANGNAVPNLTGRHQDPNFGWATKQQLLNATARGLRLIDPNMIGKNPGQGKDTNLVKALRDPNGVNNFGQMPDGGPFLPAPPNPPDHNSPIQKIIDWIDAGCPD